MSKLINKSDIKGGGYDSPSIDICNVKVEAGFESSLQGITISPWESDNDSLEL